MVKKSTYGSVKRLGSRYGRTVRFKLGKIEAEQRKKHKCPFCSYTQVKRKAVGIWHCKKCGRDFTNKAYSVQKVETPPMPAAEPAREMTAQAESEE